MNMLKRDTVQTQQIRILCIIIQNIKAIQCRKVVMQNIEWILFHNAMQYSFDLNKNSYEVKNQKSSRKMDVTLTRFYNSNFSTLLSYII